MIKRMFTSSSGQRKLFPGARGKERERAFISSEPKRCQVFLPFRKGFLAFLIL